MPLTIDREERDRLIREYAKRGWPVVPLSPKTKKPYTEEWNGPKDDKRRSQLTEADFGPEDNVGVQPASFVDVDVDALEAVALAPAFLPPTGCVFGRPSKPRSHWLYRCPELAEYVPHKFAGGEEMILELRTGLALQTMFPPSIRGPKQGTDEADEPVEWSDFGDLADVPLLELQRRAGLLACAAAIVRFYPGAGHRHPFGMALAGGLRQLGLTLDEARRTFQACARVAGDPDAEDRLSALESTYKRDESEALAGFRKLREGHRTLADTLSKVLGGVQSVRGFIGNPRTGAPDALHPENVRRVFERAGIQLGYDSFRGTKFLLQDGRSLEVGDTELIKVRMEAKRKHGITFSKEFWHDAVHDIATETPRHPVRDYLSELRWDGTPRLDTWLERHCGSEGSEYVRAVGRLTLLAAVKRVVEPGCKFDQLLILEGRQGSGKSSAIRGLCPNPEWFTDNLPIGVDGKTVIEQTRGKWICEIAELFGMSKREVDHVKAFLSRQVDEARKAYGREPDRVPRQFIYIGSTNKESYLQDPTGNRRFWPVRTAARIDFEGLIAQRDQIWAEAWSRRGEPLSFPEALWEEAAREQGKRETLDPWEEKLAMLLENPPPDYLNKSNSGDVVGSEIRIANCDLWSVLDLATRDLDKATMSRIGELMVKLGFKRTEGAQIRRKDINGKSAMHRGWVLARGPKLEADRSTSRAEWKRHQEIEAAKTEASDEEGGPA